MKTLEISVEKPSSMRAILHRCNKIIPLYRARICKRISWSPLLVFFIFQGAEESVLPAYVARRAGTATLFLLGSWAHRLF
jgi:hypothetical protein